MLGQKCFFLVHPFLDKELKMYQDFSFVFKTHTKKCVKYSHKWIFLRKSHDQRASYGHWHTIRTPSLEADSCRWLRCYLGHLHTFQLGLAPLPSPASCSNTPQQSSRWVPSTKGDLDCFPEFPGNHSIKDLCLRQTYRRILHVTLSTGKIIHCLCWKYFPTKYSFYSCTIRIKIFSTFFMVLAN